MSKKRIKIWILLLFFVASGLGNIRDDNDPSCTFEGDNNVFQNVI
jgi:hypothetical protein